MHLPAGFRFLPTDEELVGYYLRKKACGELLPHPDITELDVYRVPPMELPGSEDMKLYGKKLYFYSKKRKTTDQSYTVEGRGLWRVVSGDEKIFDPQRGFIIGIKRTLVFVEEPPLQQPNKINSIIQEPNWIMEKCRLPQKMAEEELELVICKIGVGEMKNPHTTNSIKGQETSQDASDPFTGMGQSPNLCDDGRTLLKSDQKRTKRTRDSSEARD